MSRNLSRRHFLAALPAGLAAPYFLSAGPAHAATPAAAAYTGFPSQHPDRVREMVGASHGRIDRVRELLKESPALAKAAVDWGYGDWETALGAASHVGNREIAALLMAHGARPDLFTFAMLGQLDVVKAYIETTPGIQRTPGPHGITLLAHARFGGEPAKAVVEYLEKVGGADEGPKSEPLTDEEQAVYLGSYLFGTDATDETHILKVDVSRQGLVSLGVAPGFPRNLIYLGNHQFHPVGAPAVRVRFEVREGRAERVTVVDHEVLVTARRVQP
jgi:hypothetical protein